MPLLFVYGTLKRGCRNHRQLARAKFLRVARTAPGLTLFHLGDYPGMIAAPGRTDGVVGELWEVSLPDLARLDHFEGVPQGLYARETIELAEPAGTSAETYVFLQSLDGCVEIGSEWRE